MWYTPYMCNLKCLRCHQDADVIPDETRNAPCASLSKHELFLAKVSDIDTSLQEHYTPKKTNVSPENQWLEDDSFPFEMVPF